MVVLLSGEQQGQQMEGVDVVSLELQRLADIAQRLGDLPAHTCTKRRFSPQLQQKSAPTTHNFALGIPNIFLGGVGGGYYLSGHGELQRQVEGRQMVRGRETLSSAKKNAEISELRRAVLKMEIFGLFFFLTKKKCVKIETAFKACGSHRDSFRITLISCDSWNSRGIGTTQRKPHVRAMPGSWLISDQFRPPPPHPSGGGGGCSYPARLSESHDTHPQSSHQEQVGKARSGQNITKSHDIFNYYYDIICHVITVRRQIKEQ